MKKELVILSLMLLIFCMQFVMAEESSVSEKGYECLASKVEDACDSLSLEEKIFSLLAISECETEVIENSDNSTCWPASECEIKTTAQAILALASVETDTSDAEDWLLSQTVTPSDIGWFLQIRPTKAASCDITIDNSTYTITIDGDNVLDGTTGTCLSIYEDYWLIISPTCYNMEIKTSCDETFFTNLLYQKDGSDTIYVSKSTSSASAEGSTTEEVNSLCFEQGTSCNYEGTLWAAYVLNITGHDSSPYLPYLITMAEDNEEFLPESFLYSLTGSFQDELFAQQEEGQWWYVSGDRFYDTAVALLSLQDETSTEKSGAEDWLEETQDEEGCWQGNIRNTAFILYALWPTKTIDSSEQGPDCEESGYYCITSSACESAGGEDLGEYEGCFGTNVCCSVDSSLSSCSAQEGEICTSGEECDGDIIEASDSTKCCSGECIESEEDEEEEEETECEIYGGTCRSYCSSGEESKDYDCSSGYVCCFTEEQNYAWIIILSILIVLVVLGIIFRQKLRRLWLKLKSKFKKGGSGPSSPMRPGRFPPGPSSSIPPRAMPRRVLPPGQQRPAMRSQIQQKPKGELNNVVKKLRDMGR